MKGYKPF